MITQGEISNFRQYGLQEIDGQALLPLNLITLDGKQYQFLDCVNGSDKPSDYWDDKKEDAEELDREKYVTFFGCPLWLLEYSNDFMDGEYPLGTIKVTYYKRQNELWVRRTMTSLQEREKDIQQIVDVTMQHLENFVQYMYVGDVVYILQHVSITKGITLYDAVKRYDVLEVLLTNKVEKDAESHFYTILMTPNKFLTSRSFSVGISQFEREQGCIG